MSASLDSARIRSCERNAVDEWSQVPRSAERYRAPVKKNHSTEILDLNDIVENL